MFKEIKGGSCVDVQGLKCWLPPVGQIWDPIENRWIKMQVVKRHNQLAECYWEPDPRWKLLKQWEKELKERQAPVLKQNEQLKKEGKELLRVPIHAELNRFMREMWQYRLGGYWFYNNETPTYITGQHWFYLSVYHLDVGLPNYYDPDREYFYFWQYCVEDPECFGLVECGKRRFGKTYRFGNIALEMASRMEKFNVGIQSKNDEDAGKVYRKAIISPFRKMPEFFKPKSNMEGAKMPAKALKFQSTKAVFEDDELESMIDYQPAIKGAYDGQKLGLYCGDEEGKSLNVDIFERWGLVKYCLVDAEGRIIGKAIHTSTVEDMESGGKPFKELWDKSNQYEKFKKGARRTATGLYRIFTPAHHYRHIDKYGIANKELARQEILEERQMMDPRTLSQARRRDPLDEQEAFSIDASRCKYDPIALNLRYEELKGDAPTYIVGNFKWKDGIRDTEVIFLPNSAGKWMVQWMPAEDRRNLKKVRGDQFYPGAKEQGAAGCDPYDHTILEKESMYTMSLGAMVIMKKPGIEGSTVEGGPAAVYLYRPDSPNELYEDFLMAVHFYGVQVLIETNKIGCLDYFTERGYEGYCYTVPGKAKPGISSSSNKKGTGVPGMITDVTEQFIYDDLDKVFFPQLIEQWLEWDPNATTKYDLAVAFGYACLLMKQTLARETKKVRTTLPVSAYMSFHRGLSRKRSY